MPLSSRLRRIHPDAYFLSGILLPAFLLCAFIFLYPAFLAVRTSFIGHRDTMSLHHYSRLFSDGLFADSLIRTLVFAAISVSLEFVLGFAMALLLIIHVRGRGLFRASLLVPWVLPPAIMGFAWRWIFYEDYGIMNDLLMRAGIIDTPISFLGNPLWAFATIVFADTWKTSPFVGIILLAGLAVIPRDLYEAAAIDGAGRVRRFFLITLPMVTPYILTALLFRVVQTIGIFDLVWVLTGGGPSSRTEMISLYITKETFRFLNVGYGAALSVAMFVLVVLIAATISFFSRRRF
ncbi:MAG: sugar ABC transporter permease [Candidatus Hydrogenedentota bacterium]|nr:MAG: sugar ABC transporter permease [Candidatus Hydrogenedentota bacterium]